MNNSKIILIALIAALIGLAAGYLFFGGQETQEDHRPASSSEEVWTCSMHPQIRQNEPGDCPICGMELIPLGEASASDNPLVMEMSREAVKLANIRTVIVGQSTGGGGKTLSLSGKVLADERLMSSQVAHTPGRVEQLFVSFTGERIRKGQKLATIYSPELVSAQRELIEAKKWADSQPQLLEASRNKLRYWKIPESTIEQIENSAQVQPNITVFADQSGVVMKRHVAVGEHLKEGTALFDVADLSRVWVLFDAYEEDLAEIRLGDVVEYSVPSIPGQTFSARISFIDPVINAQTRTASLRAEISNKNGLLKPEMLVKGTVQTKVKAGSSTLSVPKTAVMWTGPRSVVYIEVPDAPVPSFEFREVSIGEAIGKEYLIKDGLEMGERVVVNGAFIIDAAAQFNNKASMMNRNVKVRGAAGTIPDYSGQTPEAFQVQLMEVTEKYLTVKDALVGTDATQAKAAAAALLASLEQVDMDLLKGEAHMYLMEKLKALQAQGTAIHENEEVEEQRKQFSFLSGALAEVLTAFGTHGELLYLQHCPMAFDNAGADWLSKEKKIRNPYFGDKMHACGTIKETFPMERKLPETTTRPTQTHLH